MTFQIHFWQIVTNFWKVQHFKITFKWLKKIDFIIKYFFAVMRVLSKILPNKVSGQNVLPKSKLAGKVSYLAGHSAVISSLGAIMHCAI